jgi:hypothetical protein
METQDFLRVINELDFILDDIDEISGQLDLTKAGSDSRTHGGLEPAEINPKGDGRPRLGPADKDNESTSHTVKHSRV